MIINFFINGYSYKKDNEYYMNFLVDCDINDAQSDKKSYICIYVPNLNTSKKMESNMLNINKKIICNINKLEKSQLITAKITDPDLQQKNTYKFYYYDVFENDEKKYEGSFLAGDTTLLNPRIVFVACNINLKIKPKWYKYVLYQGDKDINWKSVYDLNPDLICHLGDQIYADPILKVNDSDKARYFKELYIATYSSPWQSYAMRNSLNLMLCDDHEIINGYGNPTQKINRMNPKYNSLIIEGIKAYNNYQIHLGESYDYIIGDYHLIFVDMRQDYEVAFSLFTKKILDFIQSTLYKSQSKNIIFLFPRPIFSLTKNFTEFMNFCRIPDGHDNPTSKINIEGSFMALGIIKKWMDQNPDVSVKFVSGDVHLTYLETIIAEGCNIEHLVTSGITVKPFNKIIPFFQQIYLAIKKKTQKLGYVTEIRNYSTNNNFGILDNGILYNYVFY